MKICPNEFDDYETINILEDEELWLASEVYQNADIRRYGHYMYQYAGENDTNTTETPEFIWERDKNIFPLWVQIAPTNYYAMLDGRTNTQTTNPTDIIMTFNTSNQDTLSLLNIVASEVIVTLYNNDTSVMEYSNTINMQDDSEVIDYFTYCYSPFINKSSLYLDDLPLVIDGTLTITIVGINTVVGRIVIGKSYDIGNTKYGVSLGLESYSDRSVDIFGNESLQQRGSVNIDTYSLQVPTSKVSALRKKAKQYDAIPILFIGDESADSNVSNLLNFGYWNSFRILIPNPVKSTLSISIKGIL